MAYFPKYTLEFDTVKDRPVLVSIDQERSIMPYSQFFDQDAGESFAIFGNTLIVTDKAPFNLPDADQIIAGDILTFDKLSNNVNDGDYIIEDYNVITFGNTKTGTFTIKGNFPSNTEGVNFTITINPADSISLTGYSQSPLEINYPNGEFDKMCPIRESKARIRIVPDVVEAADFVIDYDTQYKVTVSLFGAITWVGWLSNDLITEPFLDVADVIELSASDGLSILKTKPLADENDEQLWGKYQVIKFIWNALYHNKLELNIGTYINMYPDGYFERDAGIPGEIGWDIFDQVWMMSHTFLKGPREFDDCYEVLSKIMQAFGCTLFQGGGKWWIVQNNDRLAGVLNGTNRDFEGEYQSIQMGNVRSPISVGLNETTKFINADALLSYEKPFKEVAVKYSFDLPPIFFRNFDLIDLGSYVSETSSGGVTFKKYNIIYWLEAPTSLVTFYGFINTGYIIVESDTATTAEKKRYLSFPSGNTAAGAKATSTYPVNANDVVDLSYSVRSTDQTFQNGKQWAYVVLLSNSGTVYYLDVDGSWQTARRSVGYMYVSSQDRRFWVDYNITSRPLPAAGFIQLVFTGVSPVIAAHEIQYKDIDFSLTTSFNDQITVDGYEFKNENNLLLKNLYDNELFASHSPNVSTIGALLTAATEPTLLTNFKYKGNTYPTVMPFAKYISRSYYRTMYRQFIRLEGRLYDLYSYFGGFNPLNSIEITEIPNKEFMLTTMQIDVRQESAEVTMIELRNTNNTNDFTENGTESFRYLNAKEKDSDNPIKEPKTPIDWKFGALGILVSLITRNKRRRFNNYS